MRKLGWWVLSIGSFGSLFLIARNRDLQHRVKFTGIVTHGMEYNADTVFGMKVRSYEQYRRIMREYLSEAHCNYFIRNRSVSFAVFRNEEDARAFADRVYKNTNGVTVYTQDPSILVCLDDHGVVLLNVRRTYVCKNCERPVYVRHDHRDEDHHATCRECDSVLIAMGNMTPKEVNKYARIFEKQVVEYQQRHDYDFILD